MQTACQIYSTEIHLQNNYEFYEKTELEKKWRDFFSIGSSSFLLGFPTEVYLKPEYSGKAISFFLLRPLAISRQWSQSFAKCSNQELIGKSNKCILKKSWLITKLTTGLIVSGKEEILRKETTT